MTQDSGKGLAGRNGHLAEIQPWGTVDELFAHAKPTILRLYRPDGSFVAVGYESMVNNVLAAGGIGKSMMSTGISMQVVQDAEITDPGGTDPVVAIWDYEANKGRWGRRFLRAGMRFDVLDRRVVYIKPRGSGDWLTPEHEDNLATTRVVIFDSVNAGLATHGLTYDGLSIHQWADETINLMFDINPALSPWVIDHLPMGAKAGDGRDTGIGSVAKRNMLQGVSLRLDVFPRRGDAPLNPNKPSQVTIQRAKDNEGGLERHLVGNAHPNVPIGRMRLTPGDPTTRERVDGDFMDGCFDLSFEWTYDGSESEGIDDGDAPATDLVTLSVGVLADMAEDNPRGVSTRRLYAEMRERSGKGQRAVEDAVKDAVASGRITYEKHGMSHLYSVVDNT